MATKMITICDKHADDKTEATYHNSWTNIRGEERENDLCDKHQREFEKAWEVIDDGSALSTTRTSTPTHISSGRRRARESRITDATLARAWAKSVGMPVNTHGRVSFTVEQKWRKAGRPNVLAS
ncbi:histone-like nucleoid-structuring protein Lsr2 [Streptosporangium sp. NPDC000239]|uniref:Lsr2 dimerization domain-containing protein n=1 Tax=Streptosporangium sp. NPDC000239 TaxID=3154248 RepID=UPI00331D6830